MDEPEETAKSPFTSGCGGCLTVLACGLIAIWIGLEFLRFQNERARIPENLSIEHKIYGEEESFGFGGPGDAETGLALYRLSNRDAERLAAISTELTDDASIREAVGRRPKRHDYGTWHPTPFDPAIAGYPWDRSEFPAGSFDMEEFLWREGAFGIKVEPAVGREVNRIINAPGAYYASGRGSSLIVVAPDHELIIFAYAG